MENPNFTPEQLELLEKLRAAGKVGNQQRRTGGSNVTYYKGDIERIKCEHPACQQLRYVSEMVRTQEGYLICGTCATEHDVTTTLRIRHDRVRRPPVKLHFTN
jgi:hypothetical protein